jgi:Tol biopolymer transport system component
MKWQANSRGGPSTACAVVVLAIAAALNTLGCGDSTTPASSSPTAAAVAASPSASIVPAAEQTPSSSPSPAAGQVIGSPTPSATPLPAPTVAGTITYARPTRHVKGLYDLDFYYYDLYSISSDGTALTRLTTGAVSENMPAWSPDGRRIAYAVDGTDPAPSARLWVMDADGSDKRRLMSPEERGHQPAWSPDGTQIAFAKSDRVALTDLGGVDVTFVTRKSLGECVSPVWAPDGRTIFFSKSHEDYDIYSIAADGRSPKRVTRGIYIRGGSFALSPDGKQIAVYDSMDDQLLIVPASGEGTPTVLVDRLTRYIAELGWIYYSLQPTWSPDGKSIAFALDHRYVPPRGSDLYIVNADGTGLSVVPNTGPVVDPAWRPE